MFTVQCLGRVEQVLKEDRYTAPHYAYYVREMKIKAYAQVHTTQPRLSIAMLNPEFDIRI